MTDSAKVVLIYFAILSGIIVLDLLFGITGARHVCLVPV